jgi:hypothetical protein
MNASRYANISVFLTENGITFSYTIDRNMTYEQLYKVFQAVNNIKMEDKNIKENLVDDIIVELYRKNEERKRRPLL